MLSVKEVAELVGISVRTLHHYDEIGLLHPDNVTSAGYRQYSEQNLQTLQHILFFKELGFSLHEIKSMLHKPHFNTLEALELQRKALVSKKQQLEQMLTTIERTIKHVKGEITMSTEEKFTGLIWNQREYEQEARQRWGDSAIDESILRTSKLSEEEKQYVQNEWHNIYSQLASRMDSPVESNETMELIERYYELLNKYFGNYSFDAFNGLGQMYVYDERFTSNIDKYGEGLAQYMSTAMSYWATQKQQQS